MKIVAVVLISASTMMLVFMIIRYGNKRERDLKSTINAMCEIKNYALSYLVPFAQAVNACRLSEIDFAELKINDNSDPAGLWRKNVYDSKMLLDDKEKEIIISFGISLCRCSREQISEYSDKYISQLNEICKSFTDKKEQKIRIMATFVISAGLILVLLFI